MDGLIVAMLRDGSLSALNNLRAYRAAAARHFPGLSLSCIETWSILDHDALAVAHLLEAAEEDVCVLEVGTFIGASAFHFASIPSVRRVVTVDPNPLLRDEVNEAGAVPGCQIKDGVLAGVHVLDVARRVLQDFPEQSAKITISVGALSPDAETTRSRFDSVTDRVVGFIDGRHTRDAVLADVSALFRAFPESLVILDDCRYHWGPFVQAGVAAFLDASGSRYRFQLLGDLHPALGRSNLGLLYSDANAPSMAAMLDRFIETFSQRFDLLALLEREQELIATVMLRTQELTDTEALLAGVKANLHNVLTSKSWRLTAPFRRAWDIVQRLT